MCEFHWSPLRLVPAHVCRRAAVIKPALVPRDRFGRLSPQLISFRIMIGPLTLNADPCRGSKDLVDGVLRELSADPSVDLGDVGSGGDSLFSPTGRGDADAASVSTRVGRQVTGALDAARSSSLQMSRSSMSDDLFDDRICSS